MPHTVRATEVQEQFGKWLEAAQREPVAVMRHGRESAYLISAEEYHRLQLSSRRTHAIEDIPDDIWEQIENAEYGERSPSRNLGSAP